MKNLSKHNLLYFFILSSLFCLSSRAQDGKTNVSVDPKIDQLLKEKRKLNTGLFLNEAYKIQIFYGNSDFSSPVTALIWQWRRFCSGSAGICSARRRRRVSGCASHAASVSGLKK